LGHPLDEVLDVYLRQVDRPDLALELVHGDMNGLFRIADSLKKSGKHGEMEAAARAQAVVLLKERAAGPDAPAWLLAAMAQQLSQEKDYRSAAVYFRRALAMDYAEADWHLALARALVEMGEVQEALHEAQLCLRFRPLMPAARKLIAE